MRGRRSSVTAVVLALGVVAGCSGDESVHVAVGPTRILPRALLDSVKKITLTVYEATDGADCDATKDAVNGNTQKPILEHG